MNSDTFLVKTKSADFWNANPCGGSWSNYGQFLEWMQATEPYIYNILNRYEWKGKRVLEVGCGQGTVLNYLPHLGATVWGLDMSFNSILNARSGAAELGHESSVYFSRADAERLPIPGSSFDIALSLGVLHHTPDTAGAVREIYRILKPGGKAVIMLYRTGNPKWWATRFIRKTGQIIDGVSGEADWLANRLRSGAGTNEAKGSALLELFGVPILKAFANRQAEEMFRDFSNVTISNHQPGFRRLADILPIINILRPALENIDQMTSQQWGFYQVIEAEK